MFILETFDGESSGKSTSFLLQGETGDVKTYGSRIEAFTRLCGVMYSVKFGKARVHQHALLCAWLIIILTTGRWIHGVIIIVISALLNETKNWNCNY